MIQYKKSKQPMICKFEHLEINLANQIQDNPDKIICIGKENYDKYIGNSIDSDKILEKITESDKNNIASQNFKLNDKIVKIIYVKEELFQQTSLENNCYNQQQLKENNPHNIADAINKFDHINHYKDCNTQIILPNKEDKTLSMTIMKTTTLRRYNYTMSTQKQLGQQKLTFITEDNSLIDYSKELSDLKDGIFYARQLSNTPANLLYPASYAESIKKAFEGIPNVKIKILDEEQILKENMGALHGVGKGSYNKPYVVIIEFLNSEDENSETVALAGKGVCFDTGGISLKPTNRMWEMKHDMHGSASVVGTMLSLAKMDVKKNVVGIVGLVENMPGGNAQRPGDIVTSRSGQTIEMLNSDAEGRLVLADIINYVQNQDHYKVKYLIDYATLTGAVIVALGYEYAGLWSNDYKFANDFINSSHYTGDKYWRMPLNHSYDEGMNSKIADVANIETKRTGAGASTAAQFIQRFVRKDVSWIHLDIAGVASDRSNSLCLNNGGTGFGVESTIRYIKNLNI